MKSEICIFLTASIEPQNVIGLNRNSVSEREDDYYNALIFYLRLNYKIVFLDYKVNHDLPPQNTTHFRTTYHAGHNSNTNRINQE